jgi:hypothetical protein
LRTSANSAPALLVDTHSTGSLSRAWVAAVC